MNLFRTCLKGRCPQKTNLPRQRPRPAALELEPLEDRLAPVVGNTVVPAPVAPGGPYDGVVLLNRLNGAGAVQSRGSGSLIADGNGHYILTVAHNNAAAGRAQVTFNLQRDGTAVPIVIPVPANPGGPGGAANQFVINHGGYVAGGNNPFLSRNDIALWKLVDPQNQRPDRLLVAPFGAQQYQLYTQRDEATRADRQVTIVGYGRTGVGATGDQGAASGGTKRMGQNTIDTLATTLRSQVALVQFAGPGNFRLRWRGAAQTTAPLTAASPAATVLAALNSIPFGGGTPLSGNVSVQAAAGTPGMWWVTFTNGLGLQRINNTWLAATNGAAVNTVIQGGSATDLPGLNNTKLIADFDSGQPQNDAMGLLYGIGQRGVAAVNEVQSVSLSGAPTGGTFRLAFQQAAALNPQPAALVTPALQWNASANDVLVALQNLTDAAGARPLNGNVRVTGGPAPGTPITITFINALAGVDVIQLSVRNAALTGGNNPRVNVATPTQGSNEVGTAAGDSGGPIFLGNRIAGIVQGGGNPAVAGQGLPPLVGPSDTTFGETEVWGRVSSYAVNNPGGGSDGFIPTSIAATANYNLVLDMQTQVAGAARNAAGNWDDLTITASRGGPNNANLVITITDQTDPTFSGVYYSAPAANILTLTLRGAAGDETFVVQGNLNLGPTGNGLIEVDGRGGNNELEVHDEARTTNNLRYSVDGGSVRVMNGERTSVLLAVDYSRINAGLEVSGGSAYSQWDVSSTPACPTTLNAGTGPNDMRVLGTRGPLTINGQGGIDTVAVGNGRVQNIQGDIDVTNTGGLTSLGIDDSAGAAARNNVILTAFSLSGLAPALISWTPVNINNLNISGGSGGNTFTVRTTPLGVSAAQVTINTGTGNDRVNVLATQRRLTVNGQDGRDQVLIGNQGNAQGIRGQVSVTNANGLTDLTVDNSADPSPRNATLGAFGLFGLCPGDITWVETGLRSLVINGSTVNAGGVGNTFMVTSTPRLNAVRRFKTVLNTGGGSVGDTVTVRSVTRSELVINGQGGRDNVTIGFAGSVQLINGPVTVTNDRSRTALTIDDSANPAARPNVTLTATSLTGLAPEVFETIAVSISWVQQDLSSLTVKGGTGGNTFNVNNTPRNNFPVTTTLLTGGGNDTVNVRAANGPLTVNGQAGDDRDRFFNFRDSATIDGGPGNDTVEAAQGTLSTSQVPFTDVENLEVTGASTLAVDADVSTGKALVKEGTLDLRGGIPNVSDRVELQALGVLTGAGTINGSLLNGGQVRPAGDGAVGRITVRDDYAQALTGRLNLDLRRPEPGTQSDNLEVGHRVGLSGTLNLNALGGFTGNSFELVTNRGPDDVNGTFAGLP